MPAELNRHLETLLCAAIEINDAAEREVFLDGACGTDDELRTQVARLVADHFRAGGFLNFQAPALNETMALPALEKAGSRIGNYKLLEQIGEGGMGVVFMAEQVVPVRRRVALKITKPGMDSGQVIARFEAERQALAMMEHPNIAKVLDAGTTDRGRPYFVMELVRGISITEYCDKARLDPRKRLRLVIAVCKAVQHAHTKGIIHRDLKPSNILVTLHDGEPVPKVIDFGVAKATQQSLTDRTLFTGYGQMIGTPLYMSPEQTELSGLDVDTRSDIYSLGVLTYELLTGQTPFDQSMLVKAGFDEMRRIIREEEPPNPSHRVSTLAAEAISTLAQRQGIDERQLRKMLHGELDWIVMKALEKDRSRRYETPNALAADIERYLNDEAVDAGPPSWRYRFVKVARRNRIAVMFVGGVFVSLMLGLSTAFWQLQLAIIAKSETAAALSRVEEQKGVSERRLAIAEQAVDDMYVQVASKWLSKQAGLTQVQREFLEKAIATYEKLAETDEGGSIQLRSISASIKLGTLHERLGRLDQALDILLKTIRLATELCDREPQNSIARLKLAYAQLAAASIYQGKRLSEENVDLADKVFANLRAIDADKLDNVTDKIDYLKCFQNLTGVLATEALRKVEAMQSAELSVSEARRLVVQFPENKELRFGLSNSHSVQGFQLLWWGGRNEECLVAYQSCLTMLDELGQEGYSDSDILAASHHPLSNICLLLGRLDRKNEIRAAREKEKSVLEVLCSRFPELVNYKEKLANCLTALADDANERGNRPEADKYDDRALEILIAIVDKNPSPRASVFLKLVKLLTRIGSQYSDSTDDLRAIEVLEQASSRQIAYAISNPKDFHAYSAGFNVMAELAPAYLRVGNHAKAAESIEACLQSHAAYVAASSKPFDSLLANDLSGLVLSLTCVARLLDYCEQAAFEDKSLPEDRRTEIVESHRRNRESAIADSSKYAEMWSKSVMTSDSPLKEIVALLESNSYCALPSLVDGDNTYLFPSHEKSLQFVIENSIVEGDILLLKTYAAAIESSPQLPKEWSSISMVLASSSELNVTPKTFLQFCELALSEASSSVSAQQAFAWALYRNGKWNECIEILDSDTFRDDPCNGYLLAMAYHHLANQAKASQILQETELLVRSNSKPPKNQPQKFADAKTIAEVALPRLQWEAQVLLGMHDSRKILPPEKE